MNDRLFLLYPSRNEENKPVLKLQCGPLALTERPLTVADCLRYVKLFSEAAIEIMGTEEKQQNRGSEGMNS